MWLLRAGNHVPRLYLYAITVLALAGAFGYVWHLHGKAEQRDEYKARAEAVNQVLAKERENTRISNAETLKYQSLYKSLQDERAKPLPAVRVSKPSSRMPACSTAPGGPNDATGGQLGGAVTEDPGTDVSEALLSYGISCEANMIKLDRLQTFLRENR